MKDFGTKTINWILILMILFGYNLVLKNRSETEKIDQMQAQIDATELQLKQYKETFQKLEQEISETEETETNDRKDKTEETKQEEANLYQDGTYEGSARGFGGEIQVQVTIEDDTITDIEIVSAGGEDRAYLETASSIVTDMLQQQSSDVDTISGATFSSTGIREATAQALEQAKAGK
ncbi:MAG: FMN-binding protein [Lachnospiraceae bacterium]